MPNKGLVAVAFAVGLLVFGVVLNVSDVTAAGDVKPRASQGMALEKPVMVNGMLVASAPPAEECAGPWKKTMSHRTTVCSEGVWQHMDFEQWKCVKPDKIVDHTHPTRTKEACKRG
jgi:hypothetical protein